MMMASCSPSGTARPQGAQHSSAKQVTVSPDIASCIDAWNQQGPLPVLAADVLRAFIHGPTPVAIGILSVQSAFAPLGSCALSVQNPNNPVGFWVQNFGGYPGWSQAGSGGDGPLDSLMLALHNQAMSSPNATITPDFSLTAGSVTAPSTANQNAPSAPAAPAPTTGTGTTDQAPPTAAANGYIDGPANYTDHGIAIQLSADQAATPITTRTNDGMCSECALPSFLVVPLSVAESQSYPEGGPQAVAITLGGSGLQMSSNPPDFTCIHRTVPQDRSLKAQSCDVTRGTAQELFVPQSGLDAILIAGSLSDIYSTLRSVVPGEVPTSTQAATTASLEHCGTQAAPSGYSYSGRVAVKAPIGVGCPTAHRVLRDYFAGKGRFAGTSHANGYFLVDEGWHCVTFMAHTTCTLSGTAITANG